MFLYFHFDIVESVQQVADAGRSRGGEAHESRPRTIPHAAPASAQASAAKARQSASHTAASASAERSSSRAAGSGARRLDTSTALARNMSAPHSRASGWSNPRRRLTASVRARCSKQRGCTARQLVRTWKLPHARAAPPRRRAAATARRRRRRGETLAVCASARGPRPRAEGRLAPSEEAQPCFAYACALPEPTAKQTHLLVIVERSHPLPAGSGAAGASLEIWNTPSTTQPPSTRRAARVPDCKKCTIPREPPTPLAPHSLQTLARAGSLRAASGRFLQTLGQNFSSWPERVPVAPHFLQPGSARRAPFQLRFPIRFLALQVQVVARARALSSIAPSRARPLEGRGPVRPPALLERVQ